MMRRFSGFAATSSVDIAADGLAGEELGGLGDDADNKTTIKHSTNICMPFNKLLC